MNTYFEYKIIPQINVYCQGPKDQIGVIWLTAWSSADAITSKGGGGGGGGAAVAAEFDRKVNFAYLVRAHVPLLYMHRVIDIFTCSCLP